MRVELLNDVASAITLLKSELVAEGFKFHCGHDFQYFYSLLRGIDRDLTEHFSPKFNTLLTAQSFWIMLTDLDGVPACTVAARMEPFHHGETVASYLKGYLPRVYAAENGEPVRLAARQPSFCEEAQGNVVYLGEAWAAEKYRRSGLAGKMVKLIQLFCIPLFDPDYLYCWIRPRHAETGFPQACGYKDILPRAIRWEIRPALPDGDPKKDLTHLWLAGNRRGGLEDLAGDVLALHNASEYEGSPDPVPSYFGKE